MRIECECIYNAVCRQWAAGVRQNVRIPSLPPSNRGFVFQHYGLGLGLSSGWKVRRKVREGGDGEMSTRQRVERGDWQEIAQTWILEGRRGDDCKLFYGWMDREYWSRQAGREKGTVCRFALPSRNQPLCISASLALGLSIVSRLDFYYRVITGQWAGSVLNG